MNVEIYDAILKLGQHRNLRLNEAKGACIHVHWGRVWITQKGDVKDHIVAGGESFAVAGSSKVVVTAMSEAGVSVMEGCDRARHLQQNEKGVQEQDAVAEPSSGGKQQPLPPAANGLLARAHPGFQEIDRRIVYAQQLRARAVADAVERVLAMMRRAASAAREIA